VKFFDDLQNFYLLQISGTSDNCIFTNFPFLQTLGEGGYLISRKDTSQPVQVSEIKRHNSMRRKLSSVSILSPPDIYGCPMISVEQLASSSDFVRRWLNANVLRQEIENFPNSIVESGGEQLFELLAFFGEKQRFAFKKLAASGKKLARLQALYQQYDELVRQLKANGALLNNIRPEYFLRCQDFIAYVWHF